MPRSNSSFGVADGGNGSAAVAPGPRGGGDVPEPMLPAAVLPTECVARRCSPDRAARRPRARPVRRLALRPGSGADRHRAPAARPGHSAPGRDRTHRPGGDPGPAARQPVPGRSAPERQSAHYNRLGRRLPRRECRLRRSRRSHAGRGRRAALKRLQAIFELAVAVLQLLVLAGELPQLILKLLDSHFQVGIVGLLGKGVRAQGQHRGQGRGAGNSVRIWMTFWPDDEMRVTSKAKHIERGSTPKM